MFKLNKQEYLKNLLLSIITMLVLPLGISDLSRLISLAIGRHLFTFIFIGLLFIAPFIIALIFSLEKTKK